ncbi:MAG: SulP family sulfate permease [Polyangiales bacterium]|jgi:SulP family sulfate permease
MTSSSPASRRQELLRNITAGTTTAVVIIPQGMAYALVAGLPAIHGLYASLLPLVVYAIFGRSRELAVGPGALDTLLVGTSLGSLAFVNDSNHAAYAALLALMVGTIQLILGAFRAGFLVNFLSRPVISGFTSAAAILIAVSQLHHLLGLPAPPKENVFSDGLFIGRELGSAHLLTVGIGLSSVILLVILKRWKKAFPRALVVVALSIGLSTVFRWGNLGVDVVGDIPPGLPTLSLPQMSFDTLRDLASTALTIAFVGYLTMISIAQTFANRGGYRVWPNRELGAAGAANLIAGLSQGFPISASFSRSAVHAQAGATSPRALLITAVWVVLTLLLLTDLFEPLPTATLAAIIISAVLGLIDVKAFRRLRIVKRSDMWLLLATFASTLALGIERGILTGVVASLVLFVFRTTQPHAAVLGRVGTSRDFRNLLNYEAAAPVPGVLIVRVDAQFYFGNVSFLRDFLRQHEHESKTPLRAVVLEACSVSQLDSSANDALHEIVTDYQSRGVRFLLASVKMPVARVMRASGLWEVIGEDNVFMNVHDAIEALD